MKAWHRSLAARLWVALSLCTLVVLGTTTLLRVDAEREVVASTMVRDRRFFGESWLVMLARAPRGDVDQMVEALAADPLVRERHISVAVDSVEAAHERAAAMPVHQRQRLERGRVAAAAVGDQLRTLIPVTQRGSTLLIELDEPLAMSEHLTRVHGIAGALTSIVLLVVAAIVTWLLVNRLVARPIEALAAHARRVGAGDLEMRLDLPDATELGALADAMNEMTDQLASARIELARLESDRSGLQESLRHADRLRTAGQVSAALAHEIGTPLNVVIGRAQLVLRDESMSASSRESTEVVVREGKRIADLVRRLLGFVRRSRETEPTGPIAETVARAMDLLAPMSRRAGVSLELRAETLGASVVVVRPDEVVQILMNLTVNAIQACAPGERVEILASTRTRGAVAGTELVVVDHGPGIDAAILPHLFEPFFTTKPGDQGTGLGLSVVRGIVDERRGALDHEPTPGGGATFRVWLPVMETAERVNVREAKETS